MKQTTPLKAIKEKCIDCMCGQVNEIKICPITDCSLYPYRMGKGNKREMTDEQRQALSERARRNFHAKDSQ
jgi:hypothetical protein